MINYSRRKTPLLLFAVCIAAVFLSGCAAIYKIERAGKKYNNGYVVKRNEVIIPEFTIDNQGKAPEDIKTAEQRLKRRKKKILHFYEEIGYFGSRVMENTRLFLASFSAPFRAPVEGAKYHKYENDPDYRAKIDAQDEEEERIEQERIESIQAQMQQYIEEDLRLEQE
ncbi:MAG: hypothetical protein KJ593_00595 [Candidatus Omnitrophica bacterium]|nr:hypothetical protein [Candidatus Omnitrophota bacterium]